MPLSVTGTPQALSGTFSANGADFLVLIRITDKSMTLETGSVTYDLTKDAAQNPLGQN